MKCSHAKCNKAAEKRMKTFPVRTLILSCGLRLSKPRGLSSDRRGGGPGGTSRAREKLSHGVPRWNANDLASSNPVFEFLSICRIQEVIVGTQADVPE